MKVKIISTLGMGALMLIMLSNTYKVASTGAPIGSTGAPGETTCGRAGCHIGENNVNTGVGKPAIQIDDFTGTYIPGKTYQVKVNIEQKNIDRFGFSFAAINSHGVSSGNINVIDADRTQLMEGSNQFESREYITYKALGTKPYSANKGQWVFEWKAPEQYEGPVTFYAATVAANNDGTDKGDEVYTDSLVLNGFATGLHQVDKDITKLTVYPNPVKHNFMLSFHNKETDYTKISLVDLKGSTTYTLWEGVLSKGTKTIGLEIPAELTKGVYLIQLQQKTKVYTQKIIID